MCCLAWQPENIIIMRNVYFEGLGDGSRTREVGVRAAFDAGRAGAGAAPPAAVGLDGADLCRVRFPTFYIEEQNKINLRDFAKTNAVLAAAYPAAVYDPAAGGSDAMIRTRDNLVRAGILTATAAAAGGHTYAVNPDYPTIIYRGATEHVNLAAGAARTTKHTENNGHLGPLDDPSMVDRLFGTFAYSPAPNPDHSHGHSHGLPV